VKKGKERYKKDTANILRKKTAQIRYTQAKPTRDVLEYKETCVHF